MSNGEIRAFFATGLQNWKEVIWGIAYTFNFPPSEIWEMYWDEIMFWFEGAEKIIKAQTPDLETFDDIE